MSTQYQSPRSPTNESAAENHEEALRLSDEQRSVFHVHAAVFGATMMLIFAVNLATNLAAGIAGEWSAWWSQWALIGWSTGLAVHGLVVRLNQPTSPRSA